MKRCIPAVVLFNALLPVASGGAGQAPTAEQAVGMKTASEPRIAPDGAYVAYEVQEADWGENAFKTDVWIAAVGTGENYRLTHSKKSSTSPRWSPDGKRIAFLSDRDGKNRFT